MIEGWRKDPDPYLWLMDPDQGGPKRTDPDPQHCFEGVLSDHSLRVHLDTLIKLSTTRYFFCSIDLGTGGRELLFTDVCIADDLYSPSLGMHPLSITIPQNNGSIAVSPPSSPTGKTSCL
jgi:hypothetical protein